MRDSQKSKLYEAERRVFDQTMGTLTIPEAQDLVDKICASAWVQKKFTKGRHRQITVLHGRSGGWASSGWHGLEIRLGVWARQPWVVIHEVAHHYAGFSQGHGWKFASVYLDLVRHFLGKDAHDRLRDSFKQFKVRYRQPYTREVSEEQKAVLRERLVAAREAKIVKASSPEHVLDDRLKEAQ